MKKSILLLSIITVMCFKVKAQTHETVKGHAGVNTVTITLTVKECDEILSAAAAGYETYLSYTDIKLKDVPKEKERFNNLLAQIYLIRQRAVKVDSVKVQTTGK